MQIRNEHENHNSWRGERGSFFGRLWGSFRHLIVFIYGSSEGGLPVLFRKLEIWPHLLETFYLFILQLTLHHVRGLTPLIPQGGNELLVKSLDSGQTFLIAVTYASQVKFLIGRFNLVTFRAIYLIAKLPPFKLISHSNCKCTTSCRGSRAKEWWGGHRYQGNN